MVHLLTAQEWITVHRLVPQRQRGHQVRQLPKMTKEEQALPTQDTGPYLDFASPIATTPDGRPIAVLRVETLSDAEGRVSSYGAISHARVQSSPAPDSPLRGRIPAKKLIGS